VRITVSHNRSKVEVMQTVDQSFNELLHGTTGLPLRLVDERRTWQGSTLTFAFTAKLGFVSTPIKGTVEVTDRDITVDADLGLLERMVPEAKARDALSSRIRGLLK
jgi:hypothetical protein